ncbi:2-C-methyl-D-erythritol 4-phosphate cytidylyltransferase [Eggerthia catenaformis OT 569 = DSM 20559]|uniref:2-C-methyl-D-erythritol 4-phosphate cytidylyltransferase n=1 Tax=Eggerthia catenaformis OT 569 = DSM 20559 TaxID=999415 RepID=M2PP45_9FIRM|nr:IspD/TarI family cytidylyltransferase [Eggerthia catenaformis]EMD17339.1 2-C-methyl-D-erythritol 4-phosphate cytidylyltransferase [Eggerthia catenaformis OT 569 = DSM 20559]OUC51103.1 2-C-methyl-D-erythritol 4-phosphate cytidylyltransferase [Eggerthia catenaformis]
MNIALLTAAGVGSRMHQDIPKQFMNVENKPIIIYTLEAFQNHPSIDAIIVVTLPNWIDVLQAYARQFNITKLKWIVAGGETGQESIHNGLVKLQEECHEEDVVMIHDGNRCLVSSDIISDSLAVFKTHGSAVAAIPCVEAVFRSKDNGASSIISIPREQLYRTQTPHTYTLKKLLWAHEQAELQNIVNTAATCTLMQQLGETIYFSKGSEENLKITTVDDIMIFKALLHTKKDEWIK